MAVVFGPGVLMQGQMDLVLPLPANRIPPPPLQARKQVPTRMENPASTQIALPKDGHFGAVVVGDSISDQYPEVSLVSGAVCLAYTVYLHVGLSHNLDHAIRAPAQHRCCQRGNRVKSGCSVAL